MQGEGRQQHVSEVEQGRQAVFEIGPGRERDDADGDQPERFPAVVPDNQQALGFQGGDAARGEKRKDGAAIRLLGDLRDL